MNFNEHIEQLNIGGKGIPMRYNGSHYIMKLSEFGNLLGNSEVRVHLVDLPMNVSVKVNSKDKNKSIADGNDELANMEKKMTI